MSLFTKFRARLQSWLRAVTFRSHLESEMDAELQFHLDSYIEDLVSRGVPRAEATRRAKIEFGGITVHKEEMRASLGLRLWDDLWADLRYALRMLLKSPGFTAVAVGSLALGIGANTTIFSIAKQLLIEQLAVPHPETLRLFNWVGGKNVLVHSMWGDWDNGSDGNTVSTSFSYPVYQRLRSQNHQLQDLFAFKDIGRLNATMDGSAEVLQAEMVSGNYYRELQVQPALGRAIQPSDDTAAGGAVIVISNSLWTRRFGRSPSVIGKAITLNLVPVTIIGVNPTRFTGAKSVQSSPDVFLPFSLLPAVLQGKKGLLLTDTDLWWMQIMARVKPGVPKQTAQVSLNVALNAAVRDTMHVGKDDEIPHLALADGSRGMNEATRMFAQPVYVLMSLAGFVLLLACANIANLLLARSASRQREICVRMALGASRARVLRQVLAESLLLSGLGGVAGLLLGYCARNAIPHLLSSSWEQTSLDVQFDWRVFGFTAAISVLTGLLFGVGPAWQATRTQVNAGLKDNAQTTTHRRRGYAGKSIVAFQVALSTLLVVGAFLFVRTLLNLQSTDPGFQPKNLVLFDIQPPESRYPSPKDLALHHQLEQRLAALPGVTAVTLSSEPLIANSMSNNYFIPAGETQRSTKQQTADYNAVGESFFQTMGIPIVAGRGFNAHDTETSLKVAVVNQALVHEFFPNANPIGKTFTTGEKDPPVQIVGISADAKFDSLRHEAPPTFYEPYRQQTEVMDMTYEIRTGMQPKSIAGSLRSVVQSVDKDLPLIDMRTQIEQIDATIQQERIFASLTAGFGVLALILACIGIYGVMAYTVSRRTNEIGVRLALGAQARQILAMVLRETSLLAIIGVAAGLGASLALTRFLGSMLFGLKPNDPATLVCAALALFVVALLAGFVPARRASRVQPMQALRHE